MQVVFCSDYLARQQYAHLSAAYHLEAQAVTLQPSRGWLGSLLAALGFRSRAERMVHHQQHVLRYEAGLHNRKAHFYEQGRWGEDVLASVLASRLDHRFVLLRNYTPPLPHERGGDIDGVLVGPHGVTVFEVKTWTGRYKIQDREWYCWQGSSMRWEPTFQNPTSQVHANLGRIKDLLRLRGLGDIPVAPVIAIGWRMQIAQLREPGAYVLPLDRSIRSMEPVLGQRANKLSLSWETCLRVYQTLVGALPA